MTIGLKEVFLVREETDGDWRREVDEARSSISKMRRDFEQRSVNTRGRAGEKSKECVAALDFLLEDLDELAEKLERAAVSSPSSVDHFVSRVRQTVEKAGRVRP